jgi:hypothetical protein
MTRRRDVFQQPVCRSKPLLGAVTVLAALLLAGAAAASGDGPSAAEDRILFGTVFQRLGDPALANAPDVPDEVKARIRGFQQRARTFASRLPPETGKQGPERWTRDKKRSLQLGMLSLIEAEGIEAMARDYAGQAVLGYEWEGMPDGPLAEAASAEDFLATHPETPLRPYLNLFLAHRFRCAAEVLTLTRDPQSAAEALAKYRSYLASAGKDPDPLVRFVADDLARRPDLYLSAAEKPPGTAGGEAGDGRAPGAGPECPDSAQAEAIADPRRWALACFGVSDGETAARPGSLAEFEADLDQDGSPELFIGSEIARGNAGGTHYVFKKDGGAYRYLGSLFLHPKAFKVLGRGEDGGPRLLRYRRLGAGEGLLETVAYDGRVFAVTRSETVYPQSRDGARLAALFGESFQATKGEDAPEYPSLSVRRAIDLAESYVTRNHINLTGQHIHSVTLRYDEASEHRGLYWHVQWMWNQARMGGEFGVWVYMDGAVVPKRLGP